MSGTEPRPLPFTLCDGAEIKIKGVSPSDAQRFSICLGAGEDYSSEIHLCVNPRFHQSVVVRNSKGPRGWGAEERLGEFPFSKGSKFELQIIVRPTHFQILVDGSQFCKFGHRLRMETAKNVFFPDVTIEDVDFIEKTSVEADEPLEKPLYKLPFKLSPGREIVVKGVTFSNSNRFSISLTKGTCSMSDDTPFYFNPRFDMNLVVRNDFTPQNSWGATEERDGGFPFSKDSDYEVKIVVRDSHYEIFVDGNHFCNFNHRLPMECIKYLFVTGDTMLQEVETGDENAIVNPSVPTTAAIKGGSLRPGRKVFVQGKPKKHAKRFNINLLVGDDFETSDLALHFDVRFDFEGCEDVVVMNHKQDGEFGQEERETKNFLFARDQRFQLSIALEEDAYEISEGGKPYVTFEHRIKPPVPVHKLHIGGDVDIEKIFYE
ncbi:hypothetical protein RRG08_033707 [Elysia crispata]|uniref:Galectin n=1 Tax=Elysia crispata TaxID=231223 RepID=A0AAE1DV39_9GAST|nr:hypothetical protein RRG08_033707 [Elysia crispata]